MKRGKAAQLPQVSEKTISRRSLIEWLGKASVLALGGGLLAGCTKKDELSPAIDRIWDSGNAGDDAGDYDSGRAQEGFGFFPGIPNGSLFETWPERTVDPLDLLQTLQWWQLVVDGLVERPQSFGFDQLLALSRQDQITDFHCVEGWSVYDVPWNGVHISEIFEQVGPLSRASHLTLYSIGDVYLESIPIEVAYEPKTMLAYGIDGSTIPVAHGFPLRLVIPRMLAYKNSKYLYRIELTDAAIEGFWIKYGYPYEAVVSEGRLREGKY
ncbi:MAG: molybdopterin-dependent oxidoreductase [Deltaproteobacteria bacterium]|nr:molybdopterin-dependent oxidoreductase [Deltaproteobacteria bacterium]